MPGRLDIMDHAISHLGLLDDREIVLDTAALELAMLDHEDRDVDVYTDILGDIAERLTLAGIDASSSVERAEALSWILGQEFGFEGDRETYDSPDNADMIRVLDRRRGLPVSLTILYVAAARRLGWEADALNTPGHVLARIGPETDTVLIDPFNRGKTVGGQELTALLSGIFGRPVMPSREHLMPMSNRAVLVRLLMNQATRAEQLGDLDRTRRLYERMTIVAPDQSHPWWERARLELATGDPAAARSSLSAMLEISRDPALRTHVCAALDALARQGE